MPTVWIPANVGHVYDDACRFGELRFLSEGAVKIYNTSTAHVEFQEKLKESKKDDYLLLSGPTILCVLAASILSRRFGVLNILLFRDGKYIERNLDIDSLLTSLKPPEWHQDREEEQK